ncbi:MlaD family protein [Nocardia jiangxiensis]|uniref:MlaD family protein n=1 Tax=Nocardia jiangxiensis TaxID=282685 RepID=A0ABW6S6S1_9NOCA
MAITPRRSRILCGLVVATVAFVLAAWQLVPALGHSDTLSVTLLTDRVGAGIQAGDAVRLDGVKVGSIDSIDTDDSVRQRISLRLDRGELTGVTDALDVDYAPGNLFGVSELTLLPATGGRALTDNVVIDLTGPNDSRAHDATISTLLRSVGQLTNDVLTPQLTTVLSKITADTRAFTPLVQTIVATVQNVADIQRLPSSYLLARYGSMVAGVPPTIQGLLDLLQAPFTNAYLAQPGKIDKFVANIDMIQGPLLGSITGLLNTGRTYYSGYTGMSVPLLNAMAAAVPEPQRSTEDLRLLLQRLERAMPDSGNGPVLNLAVDLRGVPALAAPLSALLTTPPAPSPQGGNR